MPRLTALTCLVAFTFAALFSPSRADDPADKAQKIVDRYIKAIGGVKALNKTRYTVMEDEGTYYGFGDGVPYKGRYVFDFSKAGRFRMEIKGQFVSVVDGKGGWMSVQGMILDLEGPALENAMSDAKVNQAMSIIPLQKPNKLYKLGTLDSIEVEGKKCDGISVAREGMPTIKIYFDNKTGLLAKTVHKTKAPESGFKEVTDETVYHTHKLSNGVVSPTHLTIFRDGKKFVESKPSGMSYPATLSDDEFKKPSE